jgi:hypothetical protein
MKEILRNFYNSIIQEEGLERGVEVTKGLQKILESEDQDIYTFISYLQAEIESQAELNRIILKSYNKTVWQFTIASISLIIINLIFIFLLWNQ